MELQDNIGREEIEVKIRELYAQIVTTNTGRHLKVLSNILIISILKFTAYFYHIHRTDGIKNVDFIIKRHLKLNKYTEMINNNIRKTIHKFNKLRSIDFDTMKIIYYSLFENTVNCGIFTRGVTY